MEGKPIHPEKLEWTLIQGPDQDQFSTAAVKKDQNTKTWTPPERENRMVEEFEDFTRIVDGKKKEEAEKFLQMTLAASKVLERAAGHTI